MEKDMLASNNPVGDEEDRRIALHVNFDDPAGLNYVLNNAENIYHYYQGKGKPVEIRIVTHGSGLHLLREDTSPVKQRINGLAESQDGLSFYACSNTKARMEKAEGKTLVIMEVAIMVPSGLVELIELNRAGWTYIKP